MNQCTYIFTLNHLFQVTVGVLLTHCCSSKIHHFESTGVHFVEGDGFVLCSCAIFLGIGCVNAIHTSTFEHGIRFNLNTP